MTTTITTRLYPNTKQAASPSCGKRLPRRTGRNGRRATSPMLLALPLIILLTVWITHRAMRSVKTLSNDLEQRQINDLCRWTQDIPSEIKALSSPSTTCCNVPMKRPPAQRFIADAAHVAAPRPPFPSGRTAQQYAAVRRSARSSPPCCNKHSAPPPARAAPFPRTPKPPKPNAPKP